MVSFKGQKKLGPRPDRSPFEVQFKISDAHPHPFHMRSPCPPPPPPRAFAILLNEVNITNSKAKCCTSLC